MKETMTAILIYMKKHAPDEITIEEISAHFGYSKYHFSREFKKLTGFSAADYLSSIKIEQAKQDFLKKQHSITDSSFDAGFSSLGTFSTTFTKKTGLSPREYKNQVESLYHLTKNYDDTTSTSYYAEEIQKGDTYQLSVTIHYPKSYQASITFVGLFNSSIPNHKPVVGTALQKKIQHTFTHIPKGKYYLLACSIEKTLNPLRYFVLDDCLRGKVDYPLLFPKDSAKEIDIYLREPLPEDPPILINLPKLLTDTLKLRNP
ncbi:AraC family transcriptional regulator [Tetragenococcus osmophilus]|uniref:AraC family transcriptional regulator n=1 Tax=Tetragenococcus osmophilus TaxID=526944 RepID=A0AA37XKE9_9ENTE|nr:AraC family transcriptional regulator [Tetragenococcus osmophilus]AYW47846.1 AraC family transcriptional regulator [Tetragenococcus osmophilus]GMA53545.1 AraC family transcriptional regulator [Alicyclobacillus contaminans]GMA72512.1 AraC family transcriptional regulator [Tetragenococcus osmophilus]